MDNPVAMPNQDPSEAKTIYVAEMICRNCGHEPESQYSYKSLDLPLYCFGCDEYAIRPKLGLAARVVDGEVRGHSA